jgi:hypothetical protein
MPAGTPKARRFFGAQYRRRLQGKTTDVDMGTDELAKMASGKPHNTPGDGTGLDAGRIPTRQGGKICR